MNYKLTSTITEEPIAITLARMQIGLDSADTSMDTMLNMLITAAREYVERYCNRTLIMATYTAYLDAFPCWELEIFKLPISAIASVKYYDTDNALQTLTVDEDYVVDLINEPVRVFPAYEKSWPDTYEKPNAVEIAFTSGYGEAADVPKTLISVMLMIITHLEANRGDEGFRSLPPTIDLLLNDFRLQKI